MENEYCVMTLGYQHYLFPADCFEHLAHVMYKAKEVSCDGYAEEERFTVKNQNLDLKFQMVHVHKIICKPPVKKEESASEEAPF